jgi:hypothetical protein
VPVTGDHEYNGHYSDSGSLEGTGHSASKQPDFHTGWRRGILYCIATSLVVLAIALAFIGWAITKKTEGSGLLVLFRGDCKTSKNISTIAHISINALSTLLLSASNYCMHIASAPSRQDVDKFHLKKRVLDIGLNSVSNVFRLGWNRRIVWCVLALSSIPLHLM